MEPNKGKTAGPSTSKPRSKTFCTLEQLRTWVVNSPLADKCLIIHMTNDLDEIINGLEAVRRSERDWDDDKLRALFVTVSMVFLCSGPVEMKKNMRGLIHRVLGMMDTTTPLGVHCHVEYLLDELRRVGACIEVNQLHLALALMRANEDALPVGVCILWAVIGRILTMDISMHRFREFKELAEAIGTEVLFDVAKMDSIQLGELSVLLESVNRIFQLVVLTDNEQLKEAGYPDYFFKMRHVDIDSMLGWAGNVICQIHPDDHWTNLVGMQLTSMIQMLSRIKKEIPELVEVDEQDDQDD
ncbi:uncharacterized protein LOC6585535 [Drosophila mojavensis]|uniref:Uncharacterized protein, isoform A n=1 Tax=Drosophila mojavensis TaxID=7230 RepID=B4L6K9_DROMO|nr:uncharacterized protein LOC6585535 [Drosophila mojavensis]XP_043867573.1 uncharacterized protein LOC6585535 [Drosophila mojavensis]XP_043867574.1 uncharacterized protein LOC6585535 [Drosophila mojavensis]EDW06005.1 uncharacterized protein Dmoj_GI16159, isoform A [Drosophila mojavensis]KRG07122.1 uncharacterized protein Dmoj_GI16159, isoform B [Drosophila mojavensis]